MAAGGLLLAGPSSAASATTRAVTGRDQKIANHHFRAPFDFLRGSRDGVLPSAAGLRLLHPTKQRKYADLAAGSRTVTYDYGSWTSPWLSQGFGLTELISSWNAETPNGTWIESQVRGVDETGATSDWFVLGRWCSNDLADGGAISRTSVDGQGTDIATVWTDTLHLYDDHTFGKVQLRILLMRKAGTHLTPTVRFFGAVASNLPDDVPATSSFGPRRGVALPVPTYSQELHEGQYPQWDNGGEAWCSPTSTSMVVAYWHKGPSAKDLAWVEPKVDPQVAYAARNTYDAAYEGCGNWPFNTAYAGRFGLEGYVTRLRNLREAEPFIRAGIPLNLLCMSSSRRRCDRGVELPVDLTGEVALERAADLARGAPLRGALVDVGAGLGVHAHAGDDGHVQGAVEASVAAAVDAVSNGVAG